MVFQELFIGAAMQTILTEIVFAVVTIILDRYQSAQSPIHNEMFHLQ